MSTNGVNFSSATLPKQWQYVKRNLRDMGILNQIEADSIEAKAKMTVDNFFQCSIDAEFNEQLKADLYERNKERTDIRSGTYPRIFTTTFGKTKLFIPKVRHKSKDYVYRSWQMTLYAEIVNLLNNKNVGGYSWNPYEGIDEPSYMMPFIPFLGVEAKFN